ncbi:MAG: hypothetical protein LAT63_09295 [Marinobacter sp.]|nr:hypothetical protein [Marinobacter sp.]
MFLSGGGASLLSHCDLLAESCSWSDDQGEWTLVAKRELADSQGDHLHLTLKGPERAGRVLVVLEGESMYLGRYPVPLQPTADGQWSASFTAPFCAVDPTMRWKIGLMIDGQSRILPFLPVFTAAGKAL